MYHILTFLVILSPYIFSTFAIIFAMKGFTIGFFVMLVLTLTSIPFVAGYERGERE